MCKANLERTPSDVDAYDFWEDDDIFLENFDFDMRQFSKSFSVDRDISQDSRLETEVRIKNFKDQKYKEPKSSRLKEQDHPLDGKYFDSDE